MLPLDLHVLSLPLAFILSQDQTLHCKRSLISWLKNKNYLFAAALFQRTSSSFKRGANICPSNLSAQVFAKNLLTHLPKERCLPKKAAAKVHVLQPLARNKMN